MTERYYRNLLEQHALCPDCPTPVEVVAFFKRMTGLFFQDFCIEKLQSVDQIKAYEATLKINFEQLLARNPENALKGVKGLSDVFFDSFPSVFDKLSLDIDAMYAGDPAAKSRREVIRSYPGFYAIMAHRIAHAMHDAQVSDLPRIISEYAHSKTGIDIHPSAQIGMSFCIDHGTGVVIGETTLIGDNVKIYQGVTLGALSVNKEDASSKRHPTIENGVVIYAGATILGGETTIGEHSVIGGNVWITKSVPPHTKVYYKAAMEIDRAEKLDTYVFKNV